MASIVSRLAIATMMLIARSERRPRTGREPRSRGRRYLRATAAVGRIDPKEMSAGEKLSNAKLAKDGDALHVTTGPAVAYWNPSTRRAATTR